MKVYEFEGFPNPARVRVALAEKNLTDQVEFVQIDLLAGEHRAATFLEKNPSGAVPVLELEDGTTISECTAITEYLDHVSGEPTLTGRTPQERAVINMMQRRAEAGVMDAVSVEGYQNAEWGEHQRDRALAGMAYLDGVLAKRPYLAGDGFSVADITAFIGLGFADFAKIEIPQDYVHLAAWRARIAERPSIAT